MPDSGDLERRVERLEQLIVELRAGLAEAERALAHQLLALRGRANGGSAAPPDPPTT
jgi:hypothetical protein